MGYSPKFLAAVVKELDRVLTELDRVDRRIERAKRPSKKDELSQVREVWADYEKVLRRLLGS